MVRERPLEGAPLWTFVVEGVVVNAEAPVVLEWHDPPVGPPVPGCCVADLLCAGALARCDRCSHVFCQVHGPKHVKLMVMARGFWTEARRREAYLTALNVRKGGGYAYEWPLEKKQPAPRPRLSKGEQAAQAKKKVALAESWITAPGDGDGEEPDGE